MSDELATCPSGGMCALHEHDINIHELVTKDSCKEKHKLSLWAFGVLFALMSLFLALSGIALANSTSSAEKVGDVQVRMTEQLADSDKALEIHLAQQAEANKALLTTLDMMNVSIKANTEAIKAQGQQMNAQNVILEKLLERTK